MKLKDLVEQRQTIEEIHVRVPHSARKLEYKDVIVRGDFDVSDTKITSLKGAPSHVDGSFDCSNTRIKSLKGTPSYVGENFSCAGTDVTSLVGAPNHVGVSFYCNNTKIISLHDIHKQIKYIGDTLWLPRIKSHGLGIMFIKGLQRIDIWGVASANQQFEKIINKYLSGNHNPHECQEELIEAGLSEYAKL